MVRRDAREWAQAEGPMDIAGLRCLSCGEIFDPSVLGDRHAEPRRDDRGMARSRHKPVARHA